MGLEKMHQMDLPLTPHIGQDKRPIKKIVANIRRRMKDLKVNKDPVQTAREEDHEDMTNTYRKKY